MRAADVKAALVRKHKQAARRELRALFRQLAPELNDAHWKVRLRLAWRLWQRKLTPADLAQREI